MQRSKPITREMLIEQIKAMDLVGQKLRTPGGVWGGELKKKWLKDLGIIYKGTYDGYITAGTSVDDEHYTAIWDSIPGQEITTKLPDILAFCQHPLCIKYRKLFPEPDTSMQLNLYEYI